MGVIISSVVSIFIPYLLFTISTGRRHSTDLLSIHHHADDIAVSIQANTFAILCIFNPLPVRQCLPPPRPLYDEMPSFQDLVIKQRVFFDQLALSARRLNDTQELRSIGYAARSVVASNRRKTLMGREEEEIRVLRTVAAKATALLTTLSTILGHVELSFLR